MSFIEGIGDEIIQFLGLSIAIILGLIAWCSTRISDSPQIRTILIVERRSQNESEQQSSNTERTDIGQAGRDLCENQIATEASTVDNSDKTEVTSARSEEFNVTAEVQGTSEEVNNEHLDSNCSTTVNSDNSRGNVNETKENDDSANNPDNIRIRLKYLNDDQKMVDGKLQELLGDFKKRHFSFELSRQKRIRLIFNGQVLQSDDQTLQGYGLYDNCVVHCLIHTQPNTNRTNSPQQANASPPEWNLGVLLYACLSLVLGFAWFFRYHYSHLFTLTTTAALISLTGMFAVSLIGMYYSDEDIVPS